MKGTGSDPSSSRARAQGEASCVASKAARWPCYVPKNLDATALSAPLAPYDRRGLLEMIIESAQMFLSDAAGASNGEMVSLVGSRGVVSSLEAYLAYADRPFDVSLDDEGHCNPRDRDHQCKEHFETGGGRMRIEEELKDVMFKVLQLLFVDKVMIWIPSASHQAISSLVSLAGVMDVASLYYYGREGETRELVDGMVRLGAMRQGQYAGWVGDISENMAQVAMQVIDATVEAIKYMNGAQSGLYQGAARDVQDGMVYLRDACLTLCCALAASEALRHLIVNTMCLDRLLNALDDVHDELMPKLYFYVGRAEEALGDREGRGALRQVCCELECAAGSAAGWLLSGILTLPIDEEDAGGSSSRGKTGASVQRGEMLLQALCMLKGREGVDCEAGPGLGNALAGRYGLGGRIGRAIDDGRLFLDEAQKEYMLALLGVEEFSDPVMEDELLSAGVDARNLGDREKALSELTNAKAPLIRQVEEVLPGMFGAGFLALCLDELGDSPERVVDALLAGSIPKLLERVDQQLDLQGYLEKKTKPAEEFPELLAKGSAGDGQRGKAKEHKAAPKKKANAITSKFLDTVESSYKDRLRNSIIAAQWEEQEYDDEYDDTFDDVVKAQTAGSGQDGELINDNGNEKQRIKVHGASQSAKMQGAGAKPKQNKLWVLDGRVYNYAKPGARAVSSREEADAVLAEQELSKLEIHGLGPQGNKHVAVSNVDAKPKPKGGNPKTSRASYKEKHKAAIGNHHRKDRAAKKQAKAGGP